MGAYVEDGGSWLPLGVAAAALAVLDGLTVGREQVPLADVDADHLRDVRSGLDAGAPVLGGGWSLPRGRTGLPLRLTDGRTVLVPTRDASALRTALLDARGTLGR